MDATRSRRSGFCKNGTFFLGRIVPRGDGAHTRDAGERTSPSDA
jgi:hypothetical protein